MNDEPKMMKALPIVSVIIPVYNVERYLRECLESVINQTYKELQIIVVDDGSTDSSGKMCDEYAQRDQRIQVIHKENCGLSAARNLGMRFAIGKYVYFLDSDDYISLDAIEKMVSPMENSDVEILTFLCKTFGSSQNIAVRYKRTLKNKVYTGHEFFTYCQSHNEFYPTVWLYFYRRETIINKSFIEGVVFEDTSYMFELLASDVRVKFISEVLNWHRIEKGSITCSEVTNYKLRCNIIGIKYMLNVYKNDHGHTPEQRKFISWCIGSHYTFLRQLRKADYETADYNAEIIKILKSNKMLITKAVGVQFIKTLIKRPFNLCFYHQGEKDL